MLRLSTLACLFTLLFPLTLPAQNAGCTTSMVEGYYGALSDGWDLRDTQNREVLSPRASIVVMHADGEGTIDFSRELLILKSEVDDSGNLIHDGSLLINHHEVFDAITYEVQADCRVIIRYHIGDEPYEIVGVLVDGGREIFGVSANDTDNLTHTVAAFTMRRMNSDQDAVDSRLDALEAKTQATYELVRRIALRLSLQVEYARKSGWIGRDTSGDTSGDASGRIRRGQSPHLRLLTASRKANKSRLRKQRDCPPIPPRSAICRQRVGWPRRVRNTNFSEGVGGKHAARTPLVRTSVGVDVLVKLTRVVVLDPDVAAEFRTAEEVNETLRAVVGIVRRHKQRTARKTA